MITSWNGRPPSASAGGGFIDRLAGSAAEDLARAAQHLRRSLPGPHDHDAWIFDFDGTLVDSEGLNVRTTQAVLRGCGIDVDDAWLTAVTFTTATEFRARLRNDHGMNLPWSDERILREARSYRMAHLHELRPIVPTNDLARAARAHGLPVAIASANLSEAIAAGLAAVGLNAVFAVVVGQDHVERTKPAPDAFLHAARLLGVKASRCLVFENTAPGVQAALAARMTVVDIRPWESTCT